MLEIIKKEYASKKVVKETKWSKSLSSKSLKRANKFLLSLIVIQMMMQVCLNSLRTCIIRAYLMERQFLTILPPLENSFPISRR